MTLSYSHSLRWMKQESQVRVVPATGAERFSQFIYDKINPFIEEETEGRVKVVKVEFREHGKNSAIYEPR